MPTPVSGSTGGPQEPHRPVDSSPVPQEEGVASEQSNQPAFGGLSGRPNIAVRSRSEPDSASSVSSFAAHGHPDSARGAQRGGPGQPGTEAFVRRPVQPDGSFIAGGPLVLGPEKHNAVVGEATEAGTMLTEDGRELPAHEAMAMSLGVGQGHWPFYLAVDGAQEGGATSLAQRWATISGSEVIVQNPAITRDKGGRTIIEGRGPLHRFSPMPFETSPVHLAIENGQLVVPLEEGNRPAEPQEHLRELLGSGGEGAVFRMGANFAAKIFFPDVNTLELMERGRRVLDRRASEGFRVEKKLSDPQLLPSGLAMQYLELGSASHRDILVPVRSADEATGTLRMTGPFKINHARAEALGEHTIAELDKMRELLETHRPFHHDPEFNDPEIMFDLNGLPYFSDPVQDIEPGYPDFAPPTPEDLHEEMLQVVAQLREIALTNVSARRLSTTPSKVEGEN